MLPLKFFMLQPCRLSGAVRTLNVTSALALFSYSLLSKVAWVYRRGSEECLNFDDTIAAET